MNKRKLILLFFVCILFVQTKSQAQDSNTIDEIVSIVGDQIILKSDIESQLLDLTFPDSKSAWLAKCEVFKSTLYQKLLLNQALIDSLEISDETIDGDINRRLAYFISQIGSKEALEDYYGKTIGEIKDEMKAPIKEMKLAEMMKNQVVGDVRVTPKGVKEFFHNLPKDSLPFYNTEVEVSQIVIYPKPTDVAIEKAKKKITELRKRIVDGDKFENLAILYSEDDGSATEGGDLGMRSKSEFVPEFSAAAMRLTEGTLSSVIETEFGFHILELLDRKGERIHVRHILIKAKINSESIKNAKKELLEIKDKIKNDTFTFYDCAYLYSDDEATKNNGGGILDEESGATKIAVNKIDASLFYIIDTMQVGSISDPLPMMTIQGRKAYRIISLKSKTPPHKANLIDDYPKIQTLAENSIHQKTLEKWLKESYQNTYITIKEPLSRCEFLKEYEKKKE